MTNYIDLHTHSTASDGIYSPTELLRRAKDIGLRVLALTDHDTTGGLEEAAQAARALDIDFIPGIEINTDVSGGEVHVLGYFPEYQRPAFQAILKVLRDARERRGQRMVDKYIGTNCFAYVPRYRLTPEDAVHLIASANGLPVMAHPIDLPGLDELRNWLPGLCEAGMVGLETYYGPYTPENERALRALADEYNLIPSGGTDFHGPGIHPTPLGGRHVPYEAVERLKAEAAKRRGKTPPAFELPPPVQEK